MLLTWATCQLSSIQAFQMASESTGALLVKHCMGMSKAHQSRTSSGFSPQLTGQLQTELSTPAVLSNSSFIHNVALDLKDADISHYSLCQNASELLR